MYINRIKEKERHVAHGLLTGSTPPDLSYIAQLLDKSVSWVKYIRDILDNEGSTWLILKKPGGSKCRLSTSQLDQLGQWLDEGAEKHNFIGQYWTSGRVCQLVLEKFEITYSKSQMNNILKKMGYSLQKPQQKDYRQDPVKIEKWVEQTLPDIKKKHLMKVEL
jgi:transposase